MTTWPWAASDAMPTSQRGDGACAGAASVGEAIAAVNTTAVATANDEVIHPPLSPNLTSPPLRQVSLVRPGIPTPTASEDGILTLGEPNPVANGARRLSFVHGPLDIADADILARLRSRFGLEGDAIERMPLGADPRARVYRVRARGGDLLLKIRADPVNRAGLAVPALLAAREIPHLIAPIPTVSGAPFDDGDVSLVVYPFVEGVSGGSAGLTSAQWTELGATMRAIHDMPRIPELDPILRGEDFVPTRIEKLREVRASIEAGRYGEDPIRSELAGFLRSRRDQIDLLVARTEDLAPRARDRARETVICHGDIHAWNVLVTPDGGFVVIDWDSAMAAPRERDLMFVDGVAGGHAADPAAFAAGYGDVDADPNVLTYYRIEWAVQDLAEYSASVFLDPYADEDTKRKAAATAVRLFAPGSEIEASTRSDLRLRTGLGEAR
jgi:spectinomycin phosphotransferase